MAPGSVGEAPPESVTIEVPSAWVDQQRAEQALAATKLARISPPADAVGTSNITR